MSGIGALYSRKGNPCDQEVLGRMSSALAGRGERISQWCEGSIGLVQAHHQFQHPGPERQSCLTWGASSVSLVTDTRLLHRDTLLQRLQQQGLVLNKPSDATLIAAAYCVWGTACVEHVQGEFAFLLWDEQRHRLFGARSPTGLRPLVYACVNDLIICASEALPLLEVPSLSPTLNDVWVSSWLVTGSGHWDGTIFRQIHEVLPGSLLIADQDGLRLEPFWTPWPRTMLRYRRQEEYTDHFRSVFIQAVQECLEPQQALFFDLSGGLDSSSIVAVAGRYRQHHDVRDPWYGFHIQTNADHYVRAVAETYQLAMTSLSYAEHLPFDGAFDPQPWFPRPCHPPLILGSLYRQQWAIARELGVRVHIRGDFGDELLGGSLSYLTTYWKEGRYRHLAQELYHWKRLHGVPMMNLIERWIVHPSRRQRTELPTPWLRPLVLRSALQRIQQDEAFFRAQCSDPFPRQLITWMYAHGDYVAQADVALRAGLETREPYHQLHLIECLLAMPPHYQQRPGQRKFLLREAMHGILPEIVRQRQDKGHAYRLLFRGIAKHHQTLQQLIHPLPELLEPYIDALSLQQTLDRIAAGDQVQVPALTGTLALLLWAHRFPGANGRLPIVAQAERRMPPSP